MSFPFNSQDMPQNVSFTVKNVPSSSNGHVGIVEASIVRNNVCISDFGIADAESAKSHTPEDILNKAREQAGQTLLQREQPSYSAPAQRQSFPKDDTPAKAKANGGGTKPASEKQLALIQDKCQQQGRDPDEICRELCGKPLNELRGQDANTVIKSFMLQ